eukprot:7380797-Prymnesium_polylepis.2
MSRAGALEDRVPQVDCAAGHRLVRCEQAAGVGEPVRHGSDNPNQRTHAAPRSFSALALGLL